MFMFFVCSSNAVGRDIILPTLAVILRMAASKVFCLFCNMLCILGHANNLCNLVSGFLRGYHCFCNLRKALLPDFRCRIRYNSIAIVCAFVNKIAYNKAGSGYSFCVNTNNTEVHVALSGRNLRRNNTKSVFSDYVFVWFIWNVIKNTGLGKSVPLFAELKSHFIFIKSAGCNLRCIGNGKHLVPYRNFNYAQISHRPFNGFIVI